MTRWLYTAALIKRIVLHYVDVLADLVAERGSRDGTYIKMRRERNALNELWQRVKAGGEGAVIGAWPGSVA